MYKLLENAVKIDIYPAIVRWIVSMFKSRIIFARIAEERWLLLPQHWERQNFIFQVKKNIYSPMSEIYVEPSILNDIGANYTSLTDLPSLLWENLGANPNMVLQTLLVIVRP